jgi:DNA-binding beta-propeller fold protein YncE
LKGYQWGTLPMPTATLTRVQQATTTPTRPASATATPTLPGAPTVTPTLPAAFTGVWALHSAPHSLALHPARGQLYVARKDQQDVAVLDLHSMASVAQSGLPKGPRVVRVNSVLDLAYAGYGDPLYVVSCSSNMVVGQVGKGPYSASELAVNPTNHRVCVADWSVLFGQPDRVLVFDGSSNAQLGAVDLGTSAVLENVSVTVNPDTGLAYAAYTGDQRIAVIGPDLQIQARIAVSSMATPPEEPWMAVNPGTNRLYLRGQDETAVVDLNANAQVGALGRAGLIAVDPLRNLIYVQRLSKVHVYDGASNARLREVNLDKYRYVTDLACDSATRRIFLAAPNDNEIVVLADP